MLVDLYFQAADWLTRLQLHGPPYPVSCRAVHANNGKSYSSNVPALEAAVRNYRLVKRSAQRSGGQIQRGWAAKWRASAVPSGMGTALPIWRPIAVLDPTHR